MVKKIIKYGLKFFGWFILSLFILVLVLILFIQSGPGKKRIANLAEQQVGKYVNGNITLGKIEGNFFTHLKLNNLLWMYGNDTVAYIPEFEARYNLKPLVKKRLLIQKVSIVEPLFQLDQLNDSVWNLQQLIKPTPVKPDANKTTSSSLQIDLQSVQLKEGIVNINAKDSLLPEKVTNINMNLSIHLLNEQQTVQLYNFSFNSQKPDFNLEKLAFNITRDSSNIELTNFYLKTFQNQLTVNADYEQSKPVKANVNVESSSLQTGEFEFLLSDFKIPATPDLIFDVKLKNDTLHAIINLVEQKQKIHIDFITGNFSELFTQNIENEFGYRVQVALENFNPKDWTGKEQLDHLLNGKLDIQGKGINKQSAVLSVKGEFKNSIIQDTDVEKLRFDLNLNKGNLNGLVTGVGDFGGFNLRPEIRNLFKTPLYKVQLSTRQLNLAHLLDNDSLQSNLNLKADFTGKGFDPETLYLNSNLVFSRSQFQDIKLDTLFTDVEYHKKNIQIDSLWFDSRFAVLTAYGNYSFDSSSELWLTAQFDSITEFKPYIPVSGLESSGMLKAHLHGVTDSLNLESIIHLDSTFYNDVYIDDINLNATAKISKTDTLINADISAYNLQNNDIIIDSVLINVNATMGSLFLNTQIINNEIQSSLAGGLSWGDFLQITLEDWNLDYKNQHLSLKESPAVIIIDSTRYSIQRLRMASENTDSAQFILLDGTIGAGDQDFTVNVNNVDIGKLNELFDLKLNVSGLANFNLNVSGTSQSPVLEGDFGINKVIFNDYNFSEFEGEYYYQNNQLSVQTSIEPVNYGHIQFLGNMPLTVDLDSFKFGFNSKDSVDLQLNIENFPLAVFQTLNLNETIEGFAEGNVEITGTLESPNPTGNLQLKDAAFKIPDYGIDYRNLKFGLSFLRDNIKLDTLRIETADGNLAGNGIIEFSSDLYEGKISKSHIQLQFNKFNPVNLPQLNLQVSGNARLDGEKGEAVFDGDLNIPETEIYLPALLNFIGKVYVPDLPKPILVQELEEQNAAADSVLINIESNDTVQGIDLDYLDNLTGNLRIKIPKNTWVKNEDLRIELSGDLELVKNKSFVELFGTARIIRGQYDLLGKTFVINEGTIVFQGGEELIPQINITASYNFRNAQRDKKKLTVNITGTATSPNVNFNMDDSSVSEGDALSYILFGKSMGELSLDQQDNIAGSGAGNLAETAAASILSAGISNFLGKKLNVDYIEVKSSGSFDNATVVVGKYLTNDLFVSYEQLFGKTNEMNMAKYEVKLEYELFRFLFFQLNNSSDDSGFDLIFKLNSK